MMQELLEHATIPSPLGPLHAIFMEGRLICLGFGQSEGDAPQSDAARQLAGELSRYFGGAQDPFKTPLGLGSGTPFQQRVWAELRRIPFGETASYGEVARRIGAPRAARAVGQAVGANPIPILVPCHRVICSSGGMGGFSAGIAIKRWLLRHERHEARTEG